MRAGGLVAAIFAFIIAVPVRLGDDYLGIATLGFAEIIRVLIVNATGITNGLWASRAYRAMPRCFPCYVWMLFTLISWRGCPAPWQRCAASGITK